MKKTFNEWARNEKETPELKYIRESLEARLDYVQKFWEWENMGRFKGEPIPIRNKHKNLLDWERYKPQRIKE
jgi:hypothetical protein